MILDGIGAVRANRTVARYPPALTLSPNASSEFVREMEMGLNFSAWPGLGA